MLADGSPKIEYTGEYKIIFSSNSADTNSFSNCKRKLRITQKASTWKIDSSIQIKKKQKKNMDNKFNPLKSYSSRPQNPCE
jgi:hypothetical protein